MKESEARQKVCPMMSKGSADGDNYVWCEGSACAVWEAYPETKNGRFIRDENNNYIDTGSGACGLITKESG